MIQFLVITIETIQIQFRSHAILIKSDFAMPDFISLAFSLFKKQFLSRIMKTPGAGSLLSRR